MRSLTFSEVMSALMRPSPYLTDETQQSLRLLINFSSDLPDYADSKFYEQDGFLLEANAFSDYALVPLGSSAQCYWKPDCSFDQFLYLVKNLQLTDAPFVTEALGWSNIQDNRAIHVNSPVARIQGTPSYLASLSKSRRYKFKTALTNEFSFTSVTNPSPDLVDKIKDLLRERWQDKVDYAIHNLNWALSTNSTFFIMRQQSGLTSTIVGAAYFIQSGNDYTFQGIAGTIPNIGALLLSNFVDTLANLADSTGQEFTLDPTCKTIIEDQSIDIYKRLIVNENRTRPLVSAFKDNTYFDKPYCLNNEWYPSDTLIVLGNTL